MPLADDALSAQVFNGHHPETYEEWCDLTHLPFERRSSFLRYCDEWWPFLAVAERQRLWQRYSGDGFTLVRADGTREHIQAIDV